MTATPNSKKNQAKPAIASNAGLHEEIERIQNLLRRLDASLTGEKEVPLKDLEQAVHTAGDGGKSIAQLLKYARELEAGVTDADYEQKRAGLLAALEKLGQWKDED